MGKDALWIEQKGGRKEGINRIEPFSERVEYNIPSKGEEKRRNNPPYEIIWSKLHSFHWKGGRRIFGCCARGYVGSIIQYILG